VLKELWKVDPQEVLERNHRTWLVRPNFPVGRWVGHWMDQWVGRWVGHWVDHWVVAKQVFLSPLQSFHQSRHRCQHSRLPCAHPNRGTRAD
tara:strand:+ start:349 stop:621 length:273 start_codon:yes stop_codon:yes gene_type:complete